MRSTFFPSAVRPLSVAALLAVVIAGCSDDDNSAPNPVPTLVRIDVTPATATVQAGGTAAFTATGKLSDSSTSSVTVTWTATGGTITPTGNYTAGATAGSYVVTATSGARSGTATVTVTAAPPPGEIALGLDFLPGSAGFTFPTFVTAPPGDSRLFVVERAGVIRLYKAGAVVSTPFLDITALVKSDAGEQGFVGLAFDPQYASSGRFFVSYVNLAGESVLASYTVSGNADVANAASRVERLVVPHPATAYHYSGGLAFGPDGYLYMALGDGGESTDPNNYGQGLADLLGNILRLDVSGSTGYTIPASNPFVSTAGARGEVWAYGLRNPWRFAFDRANGDLYIGDVGQDTREEIDVSTAASGGGKGLNYGWATMEGTTCYRVAGCDQTGLTLPVLDYPHDPRCSVTGGYVYRGSAIPALQGTYFYADYCQSQLHSFRYVGGVATDQRDWTTLDSGNNVVSFGEDAAGEMYVVTRGAGIYRIAPR
jgi:glucose/arabinose dehydrogenase